MHDRRSGDDGLSAPRQRGVLVADDEPGIRDLLQTGLQQRGVSVWLAADGQQALDLYRDYGAAIDLVLLDVRMPGMDGPETFAALRELAPQIRCCFMSGCLGSYTEEALLDWGARAIIKKPFRLFEVLQLLGDLLGADDLDPAPAEARHNWRTVEQPCNETMHESTGCTKPVRKDDLSDAPVRRFSSPITCLRTPGAEETPGPVETRKQLEQGALEAHG